MTISELKSRIRADGDLIISADIIADMGLKPGDMVHVAYISKDGISNDHKEFLLSKSGIAEMEDEAPSFQIPAELLEQAGIPCDSDLQIACFDGLIIICKASDLSLDDLEEILARMQKARAFAEHYGYEENVANVKEQLADTIRYLQEGEKNNDRMPDD